MTDPGSVHFVVAGDPEQLTGGYAYDRRIAEELRRQRWRTMVHGLAGRFPVADRIARQSAGDTLAALPDESTVVLDGLAFHALAKTAADHAERLRLVALVHHPLADEAGLEPRVQRRLRRAEMAVLAAAAQVIVTSEFTRRRLAAYAVPADRVAVVVPGVDPAAPAHGSADGIPELLCVGSVIPRKGYAMLLQALARLTDLPWRCRCIGSLEHDRRHAAAILRLRRRLRLDDRVRFDGECTGPALTAAFIGASLFVHPSSYEGYGMVLTEALAHGLPVVSTTGGAIPHTLPAAAARLVTPEDSDALSEALGDLLRDPAARDELARGAAAASADLPRWRDAGAAFARALPVGVHG